MTDIPRIPHAVTCESRANIDEWAAQSRLLLATEPAVAFTADSLARLVAAFGHPGAGRALTDAAYAAYAITQALGRRGEPLSAQEALGLLGMAGLILTDQEEGRPAETGGTSR